MAGCSPTPVLIVVFVVLVFSTDQLANHVPSTRAISTVSHSIFFFPDSLLKYQIQVTFLRDVFSIQHSAFSLKGNLELADFQNIMFIKMVP